MLSTSEIRNRFLTYFESKGHEIVKSSPLVPGNDATLLFTNAGMVQFKDVFLGADKRAYNRATTSQRCVRAGGKHNDLENVGYTARHHTFFEMLGNFSFGDYFKEDAINFAWEFLTKELGLPEDKLWITVFEEDDEAYDLWAKNIGVPEQRIARIGAKDNFWQMGDTGPCGPCSEIFYDHGPEVFGGPPGTPDEDGDRYIEIWNLVFMQFDRSADGTLTPLPKPSVDTGMGLERIAAVMQHVHNNYEIDLFAELLTDVKSVTGANESDSPSLNVIADHIRSCAFMIVDGVLPSNEGRGYVLRRIIRRAARHGHNLGMTDPFFHKLVEPLTRLMGEAFPELVSAKQQVADALLAEELRFAETLSQGMKILEDDFSKLQSDTVPGEVLFKLYDTYGFPLDLTADIARERNFKVDESGFELQMEAQRSRARAASQFASVSATKVTVDTATEFRGYDVLSDTASVKNIFVDGVAVDRVDFDPQNEIGAESFKAVVVVLDKTPFYGESGGQVGDNGFLQSTGAEFTVIDTQKSAAAFLHYGALISGALACGDEVVASVDSNRRSATVSNHSATHLLHAGLRRSLGDHVHQKGSLVTPGYLRFDFSHSEPVSPQQLSTIETWVNEQVRENSTASTAEMTMDEALAKGAMALFGEKYGDIVRVVEIGEHSTELCGGTHVARSGDIGLFRIIGETGVASGVRRVEAVTGAAAIEHTVREHQTLQGIAATVKSPLDKVDHRITQLAEQNRELTKEVDRLKSVMASRAGDGMLADAIDIDGVKVLAVEMDNADAKALREAMDKLKDKLGTCAIVLGSKDGDKVRLIAGVSKDATSRVKAGELVNHVALQVGGKGGGRPDLAQAGGTEPEKLAAALSSVPEWIGEQLKDIMSILVQKYGGTSVGSPERIQAVAARVKKTVDSGHQVVVVVSAMSGETNRLIALAGEISKQPRPREMDVLVSTGEQVTTALLCMALAELGQSARAYTGAQAGIRTDNAYTKARITDINTEKVIADLNEGRVVVIAGFQGVNAEGNVTTLGRGGSDTSAVAMAAALKAEECQIYTDVDGVYTTDPRVVSDARRMSRITFEEMLEMASLGSKVLQIRAVEFAGKYNVALRVLSSFSEGEGTLITTDDEDSALEQALISGIAFTRDEAQVTIRGVPDTPGIAHAIVGPVAKANVEVDMIVQNISGDNITDFTFTVNRLEYDKTHAIVKKLATELGASDMSGRTDIAKVSVVGVGMRSHAGIASTMFEALAAEAINILTISTSEIKISVLIDEKYLELAVRTLHDAFQLSEPT